MSPEKIESQESASLPESRFDNSGRVANSLNLSTSLRATPIHLGRCHVRQIPCAIRASLVRPQLKEDASMGARTKLNDAYFNGAVLVVSAIGQSMQSWGAFFVTVGVLIAV